MCSTGVLSLLTFFHFLLLTASLLVDDGTQRDTSPSSSSAMADVSKSVAISGPQTQNFYTGNLKNFVHVNFFTEMPDQSPSCLLDKDTMNATLPGNAESASTISCDLSSVALPLGLHQLWVIRLPQLRQQTLAMQTPMQLNILASPGAQEAAVTSTSSSSVQTSTSTTTAAPLVLDISPTTTPVISLHSDVKGINICAPNDESQMLFNVSSSSMPQQLTCKWNLQTPDAVGIRFDQLVSPNNTNCSVGFSTKAVANLMANNNSVFASTISRLELSVSGCNSAGLCSPNQTLSLPLDFNPKLEARIQGVPFWSMPSARVPLTAKPSYSECGKEIAMPNISCSWHVNGQLVANSSILTIPAFAFSPGSAVQVKFVAKHRSGLEAAESAIINYHRQALVPIVDSVAKTISVDTSLHLDASGSWSPNMPDRALEHTWRCVNLSSGGNECLLGGNWRQSVSTNGLLSVGPGKLQENSSFLFIDTLQDSANATAQLNVTVKVLPGGVATVSLVADSQMSAGFVHVQAFVRNPLGNIGPLALRRTLSTAEGQADPVDLDSAFPGLASKNVSGTGPTDQPLVVSLCLPIGKSDEYPKWDGLATDTDWKLRLTVTDSKGRTAFAEHQFRVRSLPPVEKVTVSPSQELASLDTLIRLQPTGAKLGINSNGAAVYRVRFGIRYLMENGHPNREVWARASSQTQLSELFYETMLPTAWPPPHASCGQRIGYQGLFEVCDPLWGLCARTESDNFTVGHFSMDAMGRAVHMLKSRLNNGDVFSAIEMLEAVNQELCGLWKSPDLLDEILDALIEMLGNTTNSEELMEGLEYAMRLADAASPQNLREITALLGRTTSALGTRGGNIAVSRNVNNRAKRETNSATTTAAGPKKLDNSAATTLLMAYDLLLAKDQSVVDVYLANIRDILASFCAKGGTVIMRAYGYMYTSVQAQGLVPGQADFVNQTFTMAGNQTQNLRFDAAFAALFSSWWCGTDSGQQSTCTEICLGTAMTSVQALRDNQQLRQMLFMPHHTVLSVDQAVSNLYHLYLLDPINGANVSVPRSPFSIRINVSLASYQPSTYYRCFFFSAFQWDESACESATSPKMASPGQFQLLCTCHKANGILGVFSVTPPPPPPYPAHNEIQLLFTLNTNQLPSSTQLATFIDQLSKANGITPQRFVALNASVPTTTDGANSSNLITVSARLRPPFRTEQLSNSYAMQALKRSAQCDGGFTAYDNVAVLNMSHAVIKRTLIADGHARKIPLRIDRSFKEVFGQVNSNDTSSVAYRWLTSIARNMHISEFRFKNPAILMGILFNFTITVPFDGESASNDNPSLSAEEIAKLIQEMTYYGELDLRDQRDQPLPVDPVSDWEVVELIVMNPTSPMTFVLGSIVGCAITLSTLLIGTLVILKIRCDRLIEQHNENMHVIDLCRAAPVTNVLPFNADGAISDDAVASTSTDTVVFCRSRRRRLRGQTKIDG